MYSNLITVFKLQYFIVIRKLDIYCKIDFLRIETLAEWLAIEYLLLKNPKKNFEHNFAANIFQYFEKVILLYLNYSTLLHMLKIEKQCEKLRSDRKFAEISKSSEYVFQI
ncbi:unnamed protein product [Caenorhabditis angaria]|uniref:Uncharacterized protein n=1 Tax=Caenorhabditis angaria TaxID=860376 RepID=A0A9P1N1K3_9PELO|nr:unnamed protein product [Caenorhabditis angaria]